MTNSSLTLVSFAVKQEAGFFKRLADRNSKIRVLLTGMGADNARATVGAALAQLRPSRVVTAGFAGGLARTLEHGAVVFQADEGTGLSGRLVAAGARSARFYCSKQVVTTAAEKQELLARSGADAVEMESGCIQELCRAHAIPAATVRVILDTAEEDLALDFNQLMTPDQRLDGVKLAMSLLRAPTKIAAMLRLQRQSTAAARRLGQVLAEVLL